ETKVLYPMLQPDLYCTTLWKQAKGVLLWVAAPASYGPPGTGKTMLAKALAKQSKCFFLNVTASSIMSKWLGDANRLVRAVFSLAAKLQPCIIFIDEVDAMLGKRGSSSEHEATLAVKTEFMQLWDGMESSRGQRVVVMGATNSCFLPFRHQPTPVPCSCPCSRSYACPCSPSHA
ncbi:Protein MSP1, partial [Tetrabaena socialis]